MSEISILDVHLKIANSKQQLRPTGQRVKPHEPLNHLKDDVANTHSLSSNRYVEITDVLTM